jgi:outer membrane murein-binding lipoprotein Lpp
MTNDQGQTRFGSWSLVLFWPLVLGPSIFLAGCFPKPNKANIALRREIQSLQDKVSDLESRDKAAKAQVAALEANRSVPTLPNEKLQRLYTASGFKFKNLTLGQDLDPGKPGDEGFKIAVAPIDQFGDEFKSAGSIKVELFDLSLPDTRLGSWSLDTPDAQKRWLSTPVIDGYVLSFPWQTTPVSSKLLVKVTFTEELTGRVFDGQTDLKIEVPKE